MRYKEFEIRPYKGDAIENKWEVVKWDTYTPSNELAKSCCFARCFTIAFLTYDGGEDDFKFESVGTRYLKYADSKLNEIIFKWCEMQEFILSEEE